MKMKQWEKVNATETFCSAANIVQLADIIWLCLPRKPFVCPKLIIKQTPALSSSLSRIKSSHSIHSITIASHFPLFKSVDQLLKNKKERSRRTCKLISRSFFFFTKTNYFPVLPKRKKCFWYSILWKKNKINRKIESKCCLSNVTCIGIR